MHQRVADTVDVPRASASSRHPFFVQVLRHLAKTLALAAQRDNLGDEGLLALDGYQYAPSVIVELFPERLAIVRRAEANTLLGSLVGEAGCAISVRLNRGRMPGGHRRRSRPTARRPPRE